jgi:GAF domain-containing protein/CheY-like chemotaxis protein
MSEVKDQQKSRERMAQELHRLRRRVAELEELVEGRRYVEGTLDRGHHMPRVLADDGLGGAVARGLARTEHEQIFAALEHRNTQLRTAAEVSRAVSSILDLDALIPQVVELVRERFDLYYAGLFLVDRLGEWTDEPGRWAVLRAGTGEAGQQMLERGHKLEIGGTSMIGWCVANKQARIALDVGEEAVRFDNPLLPETRSELALPLINRDQVIGALSIQSTQEAAFSEQDITVLRTMADQLANAIANAQLYDQAQGEISERKRMEEALREAHRELERYTGSLERRTAQLQVGAEVAREAAAILDVQRLLDTTVHLVSERFGFYHAGAFLVDDQLEYAVLKAASSEGGARMLERGHKLQVGRVGIVGHVAATGEPRIALDVGQDAVFFDNPDLPDTRSEMALPLKTRGRVIGVLDVQSTQEAAFSEDDVAVLQTLADQLAVAVDNAGLVERTEAQLRELRLLHREYTASTWAELASSERSLGYVYDRIGVAPVERLAVPALDLALDRGETVTLVEPGEREAVLAAPLKLRDQVVGTLGIQDVERDREWSPNEVALVEAVSDQVALALENAQLFAETQRSAQHMRALNEISAIVSRLGSLEETSQILADVLVEQLGYASSWLALVDERAQVLRGIAGAGADVTEEMVTVEVPLDPQVQNPAVGAVLNRRAIVVNDVLSDRRASDLDEGVREMLGRLVEAPILVGGKAVGVIAVSSPASGPEIGGRDVEMLKAVADQAGVALQNFRLLEEAQQRANQLAASAEVARDAAAILDVDQLLDETVHLISEQFGFYHAGVFLLDEQGEYAVLRAASSKGGDRMLERGHRLSVGKVGIVGYVAGTGEPRIALDVGRDAVHFVNPDLPDTRSEMGLPLKVRERVIGVLDVQSTQAAAFSEDDVAVLQTLADQLATAIANARLFQEVRTDALRRALINEVQQAAVASLDPVEMLRHVGSIISSRLERCSAFLLWGPEEGELRPVVAHDAQGNQIPLADDLRLTRKANPAFFSHVVHDRRISVLDVSELRSGQPHVTRHGMDLLAEQLGIQVGMYVPLSAREQLIGVLALAQPRKSSSEEMDLVEILGVNLSVALENARLYQDAMETNERLKEMDRLKSQFLANMSHELRTPLNSIIGFSRVILKGIDGPLTDMQRTDLQAVHDSGQHLLGLINDILDISKIQAGKMELSFEEVDLGEVVKGVMSTAIALVKDKPIDLQQSVPPDLPTIWGDSRRIRQVLLNLVGNSTKFTEEGFIRVEVETGPGEVVVAVSDSGTGIPADKLENIFEEFTQVDGSSTRAAGGTGLGLSITRHFVEMHGGRIWVESTIDVGSTFYVALPIEGPSDPSEEEVQEVSSVEMEEGQAELEQESDRRVVLCVDDDEGVITLFRRYLSKQGYRVVSLVDSTAVLEQARELRPFAITLDVMMPQKDGWQVIQELKADPETREIPVVVCSIVSEKEYGLSLGASDYLVKPILEDDLLAALERLGRYEEPCQVLVVDDQAEDRDLLRRMIESWEGYEVVEAAGGQEAIDLVCQVRPDIIVLDLMMPEVDGFAVLESIKADRATRSIPIIVVTAKDLTHEERELLNTRVEALLQKGIFNQQELLADVAAVLKRVEAD